MQKIRVKISLLLLLCALHQIHGSKSNKKGGNKLITFAKNCLIALAANEVVHAGKPQDSNFHTCKYNAPDQNAGVMMKFVMCSKDQDFEKYMFDKSENCPQIRDLYNQAKGDENCAFNTSKLISDGALARFRGEKLSHTANLEMLQVHLLSYSGTYGAFSLSEESVSEFLHKWDDLFPKKDFDFFQFKSVLEITNSVYPRDAMTSAVAALRICGEYEYLNVERAKRVLELAKLAYPNDAMVAVSMALQSKYKDVNIENAKKVFELTKLAFPDDKRNAVDMALLNEVKDVNEIVEDATKLLELTKFAFPNDATKAVTQAFSMARHKEFKDANVTIIRVKEAKKLLEFTKFAYPDNTIKAVTEALLMARYLEFKDANVENAKKLFELTNFAFPKETEKAVAIALYNEFKDANVENAKKVFELTKLAFPNETEKAVVTALKSEYKDIKNNAKTVLELTKLAYHDARKAALIALDLLINAKNGKRVLELTKLVFPRDAGMALALSEALNPKYKDVSFDDVYKKYQEFRNSWSWYLTSEESIMREVLNSIHPEDVKEDF